MARLAPAECSPCAIAHAIERLLATPKTTAFRPFRSSNMNWGSSTKRKRIIASGETGLPRLRQNRRANGAETDAGSRVSTPTSVRSRRNRLRGLHRPARAGKGEGIHDGNGSKTRGQADPRGDPADCEPEHNLQHCPEEIKRILHATHEMRRYLFHQARIH